MTKRDPIALSRDLARTSIAANDPTGWFETLYRAVVAGETDLPWDRAAPNRFWSNGSTGTSSQAAAGRRQSSASATAAMPSSSLSGVLRRRLSRCQRPR